jgi:pterin-4a-carbinolamine dehydratase
MPPNIYTRLGNMITSRHWICRLIKLYTALQKINGQRNHRPDMEASFVSVRTRLSSRQHRRFEPDERAKILLEIDPVGET